MSKAKPVRSTKEKRVIPLRAAGEKIAPDEERPSKMLFAQVKEQLDLESQINNADVPDENQKIIPNPDQYPTQTSTQPRPETDQTQSTPRKSLSSFQTQPIAPVKDFNKRANSIERIALPLGMLPGASKAIYDALYLRTIGAIEPSRELRATRKQLMEWSGIKNVKTVNSNLAKLREADLIEIVTFKGEQTGSVYVVKLPEETSSFSSDQTQTRPNPDPDPKLVSDQTQKLVWVGLGKDIENKDTYGFPKTSLKTKRKNDDDDARQAAPLRGLNEIFDEVFKELTGKGIQENDAEALTQIAQMLASELREARNNTKSISKPSAFLVQHLKTRLAGSPSKPKSAGNKPDLVGKNSDEQKESVDLSIYTPEEIEALKTEFCLSCGKNLEECQCKKAESN